MNERTHTQEDYANLLAANRALVEALSEVKRIINSPECVSAFHISAIHGCPYQGENASAIIDAALAPWVAKEKAK